MGDGHIRAVLSALGRIRAGRRPCASFRWLLAAGAVGLGACSSCVLAASVAPDGGPRGLGPLGGDFLTTNQGDDTLSVVGPSAGADAGLLFVPIVEPHNAEMPHELSTDPAGRFFLVGLMEMPASDTAAMTSGNEIAMMNSTLPGYLLQLRASDGALVAAAKVDPNPGENVLTLDGATAYVSCFNQPQVVQAVAAGDTNPRDMDGNIWIVDTATMAAIGKFPVCPEPHTISLSPDGTRMFVSCLNDEIAVVDIWNPRAPSLVARVSETGGPDGGIEVLPTEATDQPLFVQASPVDASGGYTVWVTDVGTSDVRVLDAASLSFVDVMPMTSKPVRVTFSPDGKTAYVAHQAPDGIAVFDAARRAQTGDIPLSRPTCVNARQMLPSGDGKTGYVLCEGDHVHGGQFVRLDLAADPPSVVSSTPLGIDPTELGFLPAPPAN